MPSEVRLRTYASSVCALAKKTFLSVVVAYWDGNGS
jgi:hypothetical protein